MQKLSLTWENFEFAAAEVLVLETGGSGDYLDAVYPLAPAPASALAPAPAPVPAPVFVDFPFVPCVKMNDGVLTLC